MVLIETIRQAEKCLRYDLPASFQVWQHQQEAEYFCLFIGYPRSQHSLFSQIINAHPDILIADELIYSEAFHLPGVMAPYTEYKSKRKLFQQLWAKSLWDAKRKTEKTFGNYAYAIPNQWQGRIRQLKVIGDKCAYETTRLIYEGLLNLDRLSEFVQLPLKIFHVVRNPFDVISRRHLFRTQHNLPHADIDFLIHEHFNILCPTVMRIMAEIPESVLTLYAEEIVQNPTQNISKGLEFLELQSGEQYLQDCASIVFNSPKKSRNEHQWTHEAIRTVEEGIKQVPYLVHYSFE